MKHDESMQTSISEWLESNTRQSKRQMALRVGQSPSTFNRNIGMPDVIIAVCRAYELNPVEALVEAGIITADEVAEYTATEEFSEALTEMESIDIIDMMHDQLDELRGRMRRVELEGQLTISDALDKDPDYSRMSDQDGKDYGLAAYKGEENIGFDDLPHEP